MSKITDAAGGQTLTTGETSQIIGITGVDHVQVVIVGDIGAGTLTMQFRNANHETWMTYCYEGVVQTWTTATSNLNGATLMDSATYVIGACQIRFSLATAGTLTIYVDGRYVVPVAVS